MSEPTPDPGATPLMVRRYTGQVADITYHSQRCIHAEECVRRLAPVFDRGRRPWVLPDASSLDELLATIRACPSGALHLECKDGMPGELPPGSNLVTLLPGSYLKISGDLEIHAAGMQAYPETRLALCRCGASAAKPFCDNSHLEIGFTAPAPDVAEVASSPETFQAGGKLSITVFADGPYELKGAFEIRDQAGELVYQGNRTWLCRCGGSSNKPFCDKTHKRNAFQAEGV